MRQLLQLASENYPELKIIWIITNLFHAKKLFCDTFRQFFSFGHGAIGVSIILVIFLRTVADFFWRVSSIQRRVLSTCIGRYCSRDLQKTVVFCDVAVIISLQQRGIITPFSFLGEISSAIY